MKGREEAGRGGAGYLGELVGEHYVGIDSRGGFGARRHGRCATLRLVADDAGVDIGEEPCRETKGKRNKAKTSRGRRNSRRIGTCH